jgi:hypothetical protein
MLRLARNAPGARNAFPVPVVSIFRRYPASMQKNEKNLEKPGRVIDKSTARSTMA